MPDNSGAASGNAVVCGSAGTVGLVTLSSGAVTYDRNGQFESLAVGETTTDSFIYTVNDGNGGTDTATVTVTINGVNDAPVDLAIDAPLAPTEVNIEISVGASFTDPDTNDNHMAIWSWGDGAETALALPAGTHEVQAQYAYSEPGVYTLTVTIDDQNGGIASSVFEYVVVYDPSDGFVTGGGWIHSDSGAYTPDPALEGKANFGFVSKYKKGASVPTGQTQFQFKVADLNFHSESYQWLVIAGANAKFKGDGTINGEGDYGFMLTAFDGQYKNHNSEDTFRIKIWDKDAGDTVVYDNKLGEADDSYAGTELGGGNVVIHDGGKKLHAASVAAGNMVGELLTQDALDPIVGQAVSYWAAEGVSADRLDDLGRVDVELADLSGSLLGVASSSNLVWIDRDAAGYGWADRNVGTSSAGVGMDLLTAVAHELGHKLGFEHGDAHDVMAATLTTNVHAVPPLLPQEPNRLDQASRSASRLDGRAGMLDYLYARWGDSVWPDRRGALHMSVEGHDRQFDRTAVTSSPAERVHDNGEVQNDPRHRAARSALFADLALRHRDHHKSETAIRLAEVGADVLDDLLAT